MRLLYLNDAGVLKVIEIMRAEVSGDCVKILINSNLSKLITYNNQYEAEAAVVKLAETGCLDARFRTIIDTN